MAQNPLAAVVAAYNGVLKVLNLDSSGNLEVTVNGSGSGTVNAAIADGADVTQGAKADAAWTSGSGSVVALLKAIATKALSSIAVTLTPAASFLNNSAGSAGVAVKASAGTLFGLSINTAGTASTVSLYNSPTTTANLIGTFSTTAQGAVNLPAAGVAFSNGLWLVATTGGGAANLTVFYS